MIFMGLALVHFQKYWLLRHTVLYTFFLQLHQRCCGWCLAALLHWPKAYTYHDNSDLVLPGICFMLTEIHGPLQSCQHCSTGFPDCRNITGKICTFFVGDEVTPLTSYKFTETGTTTVNIVALGDMDCELTVVAVGGGGKGQIISDCLSWNFRFSKQPPKNLTDFCPRI